MYLIRYVIAFTFLLALASCSDTNNYGTPKILANCESVKPADLQQFNSPEDLFAISYPVGWYKEVGTDSSTLASSYMFADTSVFFSEQILNSLQITVQDGALPDDEEFMRANIQEVKRHNKVRDEGQAKLSGVNSYWLLVEDPRMSTLMYTLSANDKFYTINLSTTAVENSATEFCLLYDLLQTFQVK